MTRTPEHTNLKEALSDIAGELEEINEALHELNDLLRDCIHKPTGQPPRILVGTVGAVEFVEL